MKTRFPLLLVGLIGLFVSTAALAHDSGYGGAYGGNGLSGGISVWADSYGHSGYAGNLSYGTAYAWRQAPYYGHAHGPRCGHGPRYGYDRAYEHGHHHGRKQGHRNRHGRRNHH
jgi:hypothetical protein